MYINITLWGNGVLQYLAKGYMYFCGVAEFKVGHKVMVKV